MSLIQYLPVMFFLYEMVPGPERHQVGVVRRGGDRDTTGTPDVRMAQLVRQHLKLVS